MLVKYRMLSTITNANFIADIVGILDGSITSTSGLSAGADKTNSSFVGTYPTSKLTKVNAGTYTFSKIHNSDTNYTHYFRMTFSGTTMTTFTVAQGYTSGTDTLLNSVAQTVTMSANTYTPSDQFPSGINIILNNNCVYFSSLTSGASFGLFDLGTTGITSTYANNMKMAYIRTNTASWNIPYAYTLAGAASGYSSLSGNLNNLTAPIFKSNVTNQGVIVENPTWVSHVNQGYSAYGVYGLFKLGNNMMVSDYTYNVSGGTRVVSNDYAVPTEG